MLSGPIRDRFEAGAASLAAVEGLDLVGQSQRSTGDAGSFAALFATDVATLLARHESLMTEYFGAAAVIVRYESLEELLGAIDSNEPALTFTVHVAPGDAMAPALLSAGAKKAGRVIVNGFPTGMGVSWSMHHGGPLPAATSSLYTSVGATAVRRWLRPCRIRGCRRRGYSKPCATRTRWESHSESTESYGSANQ